MQSKVCKVYQLSTFISRYIVAGGAKCQWSIVVLGGNKSESRCAPWFMRAEGGQDVKISKSFCFCRQYRYTLLYYHSFKPPLVGEPA